MSLIMCLTVEEIYEIGGIFIAQKANENLYFCSIVLLNTI